MREAEVVFPIDVFPHIPGGILAVSTETLRAYWALPQIHRDGTIDGERRQ
jgi:hypothetical protein